MHLFKIFLSILSIFLLTVLNAQEGIRIFYEFEDIQPNFLEAKKEPNTVVMNFSYHELIGNNQISKFSSIKDLRFENRIKQEEEENTPIKQMFVSSFFNGSYYNDFENKLSYSDGSVDNKHVLVVDSLGAEIDWQLKRESKKVLNFDTKLATFENESKTVEVWYAPGLPFKIGPLNYTGLPGAILELTIDYKGNDPSIMFLQATDVEVLDALHVEIPTDLEQISNSAYQIIREAERQKWLEMHENNGVDTSD